MTESSFGEVQRELRENPFAVTKAVDFSDQEIDTHWVEWPETGGFADLLNVASPMARIVTGGKGAGRTHILRHFSAPVQAIRTHEGPLEQVQQDGVLGIYARCSGLNSRRFRRRGIAAETWEDIFAQYTDVWLAQAVLDAFAIVTAENPPSEAQQRDIVTQVRDLLIDSSGMTEPANLGALRQEFFGLQRSLDRAIADAAFGRPLPSDLTLQTFRGALAFGLPLALREHYPPLKDTMFLYLLDEFENFTEVQQRYIQTLVREKTVGVSFVIGVRTYGLRTLQTLSAGEENKRGSEFDEIDLDRRYLAPGKQPFATFCIRLVSRRLARYGFLEDLEETARPAEALRRLRGLFDVSQPAQEEQWAIGHYDPQDRPYLKNLTENLTRAEARADAALEISGNVDFILDAVRIPSRPLLEKVNIFFVYREWSRGRSLRAAAEQLLSTRSAPDSTGTVHPTPAQRAILKHYATDLRAQLNHDMAQPQTYSGIDQFITMSRGLPRNLLVMLKNIYRWSVFNGEQPFQGERISLESQRLGVREAADWFFEDAKPEGEEGESLQAAIRRLGEMFRRFRFSDKPVESSLAAFSADLTACSQVAREMVNIAAERSLLLHLPQGQKERNTGIVEAKLQLNPLLSPLWDLPTARRGAVRLAPEEVNAIFDSAYSKDFRTVLGRRLRRMDAPFHRATKQSSSQEPFHWEA